jgi:2-(1,2-epoxy-1,2-dihydrophenyl)acetyl-CoA isomerase
VAGAAEFPAAVRQLAERLAGGPASALGLIKRSFDLALGASLEQALDYEAQAQQVAGLSPEYAEGVQAFTEKRTPKFR